MEDAGQLDLDASQKLLQAMGQIQDFLSEEETMDRLRDNFSSFRLERERSSKATVASDAEPTPVPQAEVPNTVMVSNLLAKAAPSNDRLPFMGVVSRPAQKDADQQELVGRARGDSGMQEESRLAPADWDADVEDICEREPSAASRPSRHKESVQAPRPSVRLRRHGEEAPPRSSRLIPDLGLADPALFQQSSSAPRLPPQGPALGPSASLWRVNGQQLGSVPRAPSTPPGSAARVPGRMQVNLNGSSPRMLPPDSFAALELSNPYVKALRAHREELLRSTVDLNDMQVDSLAARLATRDDSLPTLNTSEGNSRGAPDRPAAFEPSFAQFRCGPEPCGDLKGSAELEEIFYQQQQCYGEVASYRLCTLQSEQLDSARFSQNVYLEIDRRAPAPQPNAVAGTPRAVVPDTARSAVDLREVAEGLPSQQSSRLPGKAGYASEAPVVMLNAQDT